MNFKAHYFPGWDKPVYLPDWLAVETKIISPKVPGWTGGAIASPDRLIGTTWHDTGNLQSNANGEYTWAANGGRADIPGGAGNYTGIFDETKLIITSGINELSQATATPEGNRVTLSFEQAGIGPAFDFEKSWLVGTYVHAGFLHAIGTTAKANMYQHNYWSGKHCPAQIRNRGWWGKTEDRVDANIAEIRAFLQGGSGKPEPAPQPSKRTATIRFESLLRSSPGFYDYANKRPNIQQKDGKDYTLPAGTVAEVIDGPRMAEGIEWFDLKLPNGDTGWVAMEVKKTMEIR